MVDRDGDETGVRERLGGVMVPEKRAAMAMRDDDERQLLARHRTIFGDGEDVRTHLHLARRLGAWIPDRAHQRFKRPVRRNLDALEAGRMRQRRRKTKNRC